MSQLHLIEYTPTCSILFINWLKIINLSKPDFFKKFNMLLTSYDIKIL